MFASKDTLLTRPSGYQIQRSLRFRSSASAYLSRTFGTPTNNNTWTFSTWMKRGSVSSGGTPIFVVYVDGNNYTNFTIDANQQMNFAIVTSGVARANSITSQVFRDPSSWYHVVLVANRAEATEANRIKMYINGVQVTAWATAPTWNNSYDSAINGNGQVNLIGNRSTAYFDGYLAEINFIDGQALTPSSFGAINATTGVWSATKYAGTYGTNGFYLNFTDNSAATATTIGKDNSGNGNNWTPNNISVTAGVTYDSMLDAPLGAGGGERGNYCVLNPLRYYYANGLSNGNLTITNPVTTDHYANTGTVALSGSTSKFYAEMLVVTSCVGSTVAAGFGFANDATLSYATDTGNYIIYSNNNNGKIFSNGVSLAANIASIVAGANDIYQIAFDSSTGNAWVGKNNTWYNNTGGTTGDPATGANPTFTLSGNIYPYADAYNNTVQANFGQRPFSYTPPTGFKALHTGNLAAPVIALPAQNMAATLYTGNGSTQSIVNTVNGVSFQPDWVWIKSRSNALNSGLMDSVRGPTKLLISNATNAEQTLTDELTSFNSNGFSLGVSSNGYTNYSPYTYVAWQWKAGGTAVTNTAGSITSSVSANTTAGFSVVTYTGNGTSNATVGHGLGATPSMVIVKIRNAAANWVVYHSRLNGGVTPQNYYLYLSTTNAEAAYAQHWNNTAPTSSLITLGNDGSVNGSSNTFVAYCFAPVAGYSAFGSYTGNGSADGPFVYLGFRPRWVMVKITNTTNNWLVWDSSRDASNVVDLNLRPNLSDADSSEDAMDFLSNGFKLRSTSGGWNGSGNTYIYACFAEDPFKNSLAR